MWEKKKQRKGGREKEKEAWKRGNCEKRNSCEGREWGGGKGRSFGAKRNRWRIASIHTLIHSRVYGMRFPFLQTALHLLFLLLL